MQDKAGIIIDRREMLKVKVKSLAAEAAIIRKEEGKATAALQSELHEHRVKELRWAARDAHIAYGMVRGRRWDRMEPKRGEGSAPNWKKVFDMFLRYGLVKNRVDRKAAEKMFVELQGVIPTA